MPVLGCGAEMAKLMEVSDQDIAVIEDTIAERLELGVSQAQAQRQAVDEALAQLADERSMVMKAVQEQLGVKDVPEVRFGNKANDMFPEEFATPDTEGDSGVKINSKGATRKGANVNSDGQQITATKQGVDNFWKWFGDSAAADAKGRPLVLYHSTNGDFNTFEPGRETVNSTTFGDVETQRHGVFMSPDKKFSQEYLREGEGQNVMQVYASIQNPIDLREGINGDDLNAIVEAHGNDGLLTHRDFNYVDPYETWTFFDGDFGKRFVDAAKAAGFDGAIMLEAGPDGNKPATTYVAFDATQVKSATGNLGTFNADSGDIRFANKAQIEQEAYDMIEADPEGMVESYLTKHKNVIDPDLVKGMFPAFAADPSLAAAVHEPSSKLAKMIYTEALGRNKGKPVVFTAGGGGSGKSEAMPVAMQIAGVDGNPLTYDSTLSSYSSAIQRIDQALGSKSPVLIVYTNAPVARAFQFAMGRERVVPATTLTSAHVGSSNTIRRLAEHYKGNDAVRIIVVNNDGDKADIRVGKLDDVHKYDHNVTERSLYELASQARDSGQITNEKFAALMAQPRGDGGTSPSSNRAVQEGYGRQELGRPSERAGSEEQGGLSFANKARSKWRDETGRLQFAPGQLLWDTFNDRAMPILDRLYLTRPDQKTRQVLRKMKIDVQKAQGVAVEMATEVNKMSPEERKLVSDIIEKELKAGVTPPASAVRTAAMMNDAFKIQTDELVRLGMLSKDSADRWKGKYLPRYYESHVGSNEEALKVLGRDRKPGIGIKGQHLRGRGLMERIGVDELADYKAEGWEVRDKGYEEGTSKMVHVWRDFTKAEREKMKEIRDAGFRFVMGYMSTQKDIALGRMYEQLADSDDWSSTEATPEMTEFVPDTTAAGTGANKFGKLGGRYVSKALWSQLSAQQDLDSEAFKLYKKALSIWKEGKVVLNPVSHMNNFMSNMTNAHFAGVSYWDVAKYAGTIKDLASKAPLVKEANDNGLWLGTLTQEELGGLLPPELQSLIAKQDSKTVTGIKLAYNVMTWGLRKPMGAAYEFGDKFFKYMIYKDARARGLEPQDAVDYAHKYIFNYDDLPLTARRIRDYGMPFFSYTYKLIPMLAETALTHPHRLIGPASVLSIAGMAAYAIAAGGDDDEWESVKKYVTDPEFRKQADAMRKSEAELLPEWMKGRTSLGSPKVMRLGEDDKTKLPVFLDTARFIPGGDLFDLTGNAGGVPFLQPFTPNNPLLTTFAAMFVNRDPFTGKDIVNKRSDGDLEAGEKRAAWMWKMAAPAVAINQSHWNRAVQAVANETGSDLPYLPDFIGGDQTGVGSDGLPVQGKYAAMNTVGIKARPQDLEFSETRQKIDKAKTLKELDTQLFRARTQYNADQLKESSYEKLRERIQEKRDRVKDGLTVDGDEK